MIEYDLMIDDIRFLNDITTVGV